MDPFIMKNEQREQDSLVSRINRTGSGLYNLENLESGVHVMSIGSIHLSRRTHAGGFGLRRRRRSSKSEPHVSIHHTCASAFIALPDLNNTNLDKTRFFWNLCHKSTKFSPYGNRLSTHKICNANPVCNT